MDENAVRVGIDENGLGPLLGPLVVTAVVARTTGPAGAGGHSLAEGRPRGALRARLGDSKRLVAFGDTRLGEAWARAIARRMGPCEPADPDALVARLSLDSPQALHAPCPGNHAEQCWSAEGETFAASAELVARVSRDLGRLEDKGVDVRRAACVVTCARRLNEGLAHGRTRFHTDLHAMERLVLDARERTGAELVATCGKVGGFGRYSSAFGPMGGRLHAVVEEGRARSEYAFPGIGRVAFVRDADESHLLVCMASLVGKWVRDLLMARIVRYHQARQSGLGAVSGYHDPLTRRFVDATRQARRLRALPDDCFERRASEGKGRAAAPARSERAPPRDAAHPGSTLTVSPQASFQPPPARDRRATR